MSIFLPLIAMSVVVAFLGAFAVSWKGEGLGLMDRPNQRSSHSRPTPKGGGIGILAAFCLAAIWLDFPILVWLPALALALVSLLGDRFELSPRWRLLAQFVAAAIACGQVFSTLPAGSGVMGLGFVPGMALAMFFVVATANTVNFMDGIDGIAGINGIIAFALLAVAGWQRGEAMSWVLVAVSLAAACAGFLPWNFPRARVFMGDVGSILLGFVFALFVLVWSENGSDLLLFGSFLFPFLADEGVTLLARLRRGDNLIVAHRRHVYQILANQRGIAHRWISLAYGAIQLGVGAVMVWLCPPGWLWRLSWLALVAGLFLVAAKRIRRWE